LSSTDKEFTSIGQFRH